MQCNLTDRLDRDARCGASLYADKKGKYKTSSCNTAVVSITPSTNRSALQEKPLVYVDHRSIIPFAHVQKTLRPVDFRENRQQ